MKKKRRLTLHRETVVNFGSRGPARAAGGGETYELATGCACTDGCDTGFWCGTLYACSADCNGSANCTGFTYEIYSGCATNC